MDREEIRDAAGESVAETIGFVKSFVIMGGFVGIPLTTFITMLAIFEAYGDGAMVVSMPFLMVAMIAALSFWVNLFGADNPAPPL